MDNELAELERTLGGLVRNMEIGEQRKLLRRMATKLKKSQADRIARQQGPDGSAFTPRRKPKEPEAAKHPLKFLYPEGGSGTPRLVYMRSWIKQGDNYTGFDVQAGALRSFTIAKITQHIPLGPGEKRGGGRLRRKGHIRATAMFKKLRGGRHLKSGVTDQELWVGFSGRAAGIARIHQYGLRDRPSRKAMDVAYAKRELIGLSPQDRDDLLDAVLEHMFDAG